MLANADADLPDPTGFDVNGMVCCTTTTTVTLTAPDLHATGLRECAVFNQN